jgi:hypothetical protein
MALASSDEDSLLRRFAVYPLDALLRDRSPFDEWAVYVGPDCSSQFHVQFVPRVRIPRRDEASVRARLAARRAPGELLVFISHEVVLHEITVDTARAKRLLSAARVPGTAFLPPPETPAYAPIAMPPTDAMLKELEGAGVRVLPDAAERLEPPYRSPRDRADAWELLLVNLAQAELAANLWHLDTECIDTPRAYDHIAERTRDVCCGDLPVESIVSDVPLDEDEGTLSFHLDGRAYEWTVAIQGDWLDTTVLDRFAELLAARATTRRIVIVANLGQAYVLGTFTSDELDRLRALTGLAFDVLARP